MSDDLVKCLNKGVASVEQQQDVVDLIEELEDQLAKAFCFLISSGRYGVYTTDELEDLLAELKGQNDE